MDTRDAISREEGSFTMSLGGDNPRFEAIKLSLGSLEFPMVQWSIEQSWSNIYFSEGYRLNTDAHIRIFEKTDQGSADIVAFLPPHINEIRKICASEDREENGFVVTCAEPHRLFYPKGSMISTITWGDVEIICGTMGRVSLTRLYEMRKVSYVSDNSFFVSFPGCNWKTSGFIYVPPYPSPSALCQCLTFSLHACESQCVYEAVYDAPSNKVSISVPFFPDESTTLTLRLYGGYLARLLGYISPVHEAIFRKPAGSSVNISPIPTTYFEETGDRPPLRIPSDQFQGWISTGLECGWYVPAHRPMCTGQPLKMTQELESALNRLIFPVPERVPQGMATAHFLMFSDPGGVIHNCPVYCGIYTAESLALVLETEMTRLSHRSMPGTSFTVEYEFVERRFTFTCEIKDQSGLVHPAPFCLFFSHPAQFDPSRIGFHAVTLQGRDTYTSSKQVSAPSTQSMLRPQRNTYRVTEVGHQKVFRIQTSPSLFLVGLITGYDTKNSILSVRTYMNQLPYAHGFLPGDVVNLTTTPKEELYRFVGNGWKTDGMTDSCPLAPSWGRCGIVVNLKDSNPVGFPMPGFEQVDLCLKVKPTPDLADCIDTVLGLKIETNPFNFCFDTMPQSIPGKMLGFKEGATQWGIDGNTTSSRLMVPPYDAHCVHSIDHPDYILMYITEGKMGTSLQHKFGTNNTTPFAKLVLYPMVREERMLPRDTTLLSGEGQSVFTIRFTNPDGTPYHFHGANFSFSLHFLKVQQ